MTQQHYCGRTITDKEMRDFRLEHYRRLCPSARFENETWPNMLAKWDENNEIYDADQREIAEYIEDY